MLENIDPVTLLPNEETQVTYRVQYRPAAWMRTRCATMQAASEQDLWAKLLEWETEGCVILGVIKVAA